MCRDDDEMFPTNKLCQAIATLLLEQMTFQLLLTSDLDGGVSMATRTQSKQMLTGMLMVDGVHAWYNARRLSS